MTLNSHPQITPMFSAERNAMQETMKMSYYTTDLFGPDRPTPKWSEWTKLMTASMWSSHDFEAVLAKSCVNDQDPTGWSALMLATRIQNVIPMTRLLQHGADPNLTNNYGWNSLMINCYLGTHETTKLLIESSKSPGDLINAQSKVGLTALMMAAQNGNADMVKQLLQTGADMEATTQDGHTALMIAIHAQRDRIVNILLSMGANTNAVSKDGCTALMVDALLKHGANVNASTCHNASALIYACFGLWEAFTYKRHVNTGCRAVIALLLQFGSRTSHVTHDGQTAMIILEECEENELMKVLFDHGAQGTKDQFAMATVERKIFEIK